MEDEELVIQDMFNLGDGLECSCFAVYDGARDDEIRRIEGAGGFVKIPSRFWDDSQCRERWETSNTRTSRRGKPPLVVGDPEIRMERLTPADEFLLLACDGLFDVFSSQDATNFVRSRLAQMPPGEQVDRNMHHKSVTFESLRSLNEL
ncbi:uncharacterized protein LOC129617284 [Condylostylus longicornis]|uniref:uncharacterized protein LOC129617284 n=1 Tax=Condylostylus longicornis TaxID=2530218 RepID=UPI00244DE220|nr:uncharacterized protein LOC129617284 [Condylostylus longicornis]